MSLGNTHLGEQDGYELVDVHFSRTSVFSKDRSPTIPTLCDFVMRAGYPKASEVKRVKQLDSPDGRSFRLYIQREPCPVMLLPGQDKCPICGEEHQ